MLSRSKIILYLLILGGIFIYPNFVLAANVVINEIMYNLPGTDSKHEWIEILNTSDAEIDLTGWKFNDGSNHILNEPPKNGGQGLLRISAGEYVILTEDAATFLTDYPGFSGTVIDTVMSLNNTSATLKILNSENNEIDLITYENIWGADGDGKTLEKINPQGTNTQNNWQISVSNEGTPGILNSSGQTISPGEEPPTEDPVINDWTPPTVVNNPPTAKAGTDITALVNQEISFDGSQSSDPDNDILTYFWNFGDGATDTEKISTHTYLYPGQYIVSLLVNDGELSNLDVITVNIYEESIIISEFNNEWIELYNQSNQVANLTNWQLDDQEQGSSTPFIFPLNSLIAPNQFLVLRQQITKLAFNDESDQIRLIYPDGSVAIEVSYDTEEKQGLSIAFNGSDYFWTKTPTPGSVNIISSTNLNNKNENISSNNPEPIIEEAQEIPETLTKTNLTQSKNLSVINPLTESDDCLDNLTDSCIIEQDLLSNKGNIAEQQVASLAQTTQSSQKSKLILYISIIISASLIISWGLIRLRH